MKKRVASAIVMIAVFVPILLLGGITFSVFMTILALGGMYELIHIRENKRKFPFFIKGIAYLFALFFSVSNYSHNIFSYELDYRMIAILIFAFLLPILFMNQKKEDYHIPDALYMISALLFITLSFNLVLLIRNYDLNYLIYLVLITVITDTFAFLTGKYIGEHTFTEISPHKTIEGCIGGVIMGTFIPTVFYFTVINSSISLVLLIFVTALLSILGQCGDLVFSSIKRTYKVKDFSNLIPGHGGILDRFDSLIFVVLAFVLVSGII